MKSASYKHMRCDRCQYKWTVYSSPRGLLYASVGVREWVKSRVELSRYIWELARGCQGCAEVYEDKARVMANLLARLGISPLSVGMISVKKKSMFIPWSW